MKLDYKETGKKIVLTLNDEKTNRLNKHPLFLWKGTLPGPNFEIGSDW